MEAFANTIGLRSSDLGLSVFNVVDRLIRLVRMECEVVKRQQSSLRQALDRLCESGRIKSGFIREQHETFPVLYGQSNDKQKRARKNQSNTMTGVPFLMVS
jgi:hypothetical protein